MPRNSSNTSKKKILYIVLSLFPGGLENGLVNLINNSGDEFEHIVCCLLEKGLLASRLKKKHTLIEMNMGTGNNYCIPLKIAQIIVKEQIDLVRAFTEDPLFYSFLPAIVHRRPLIYYSGGRTFPEKKKKLLFERFCSNRTSAVVVPSEDLKKYMSETVRVDEDKIRVITNGVNIERFDHFFDTAQIKRDLNIPQEDLIVGTIGRLVDQKDYKTFLEIARIVIGQGNNYTFLIVGDGVLRGEIECKLNRYGIADKIRLLGTRNDIEAIHHLFDVFLITPKWEGMSNVVLEAMACKKPVLATRVEGMSDIIDHGINGYLFPTESVRSFVETLLNLTHEKRAQIGENAYRKVKEKFSLEQMVTEYENLYRAVLS